MKIIQVSITSIKMRRFILLYVLLEVTFGCISDSKYQTCGCNRSRFKYKNETISGKKLDCDKINVAYMFANAEFPKDIKLLAMDLSNNNVREISKATFGKRPNTLRKLKQVIKLDLSNNEIYSIAPDSFSVFPLLARLNLSSNSIGRLSSGMFTDLGNLIVLDLSMNIFPIIDGNVFSSLQSLERLYLRSTAFVCNCLMKDFIEWRINNSSLQKFVGHCHLPANLEGKSLRSLDVVDLKCDETNTLTRLPHFEMLPHKAQLVFEGDYLLMQCEGTDLPTSDILWSFNGSKVDLSDDRIYTANTTTKGYQSVIAGSLKITNLSKSHTGNWGCTVKSRHGNESHTVKIEVLSHDASYCESNTVENDRGEFLWPSIVSGLTKSLQCPFSPSRNVVHKAYRSCDNGDWISGGYFSCLYKDKATRLIFNTMKMKLDYKNAGALVQKLIKDLGNKPIVEPLAVEFAGNLMEKLMTLIIENSASEIGQAILDFASYIMDADALILQKAQITSRACEKILLAVRSSALDVSVTSSLNRGSSNIAVSRYSLGNKVPYGGLMCTVKNSYKNLNFKCVSEPKNRDIHSFISLPGTLLDSCEESDSGNYRLYFIAYRSSGLFQPKPHENNSNSTSNITDQDIVTATNMVLEAGISGCSTLNFSKSIVFNFKNVKSGMYNPIVWSPTQGWVSDDGCLATAFGRNTTRVSCNRLANVTILYDPSSSKDNENPWSLSNLAHPIVFAGTGVLIVCLIAVIMSYVCCSNRLRISSNSRHMLINICVHLLLVSFAFALGIWKVDYKTMCLACGVVLHYASLAVLSWITISARNIYRELIVNSRPPSVDPKPPRPMLRFYLFGCGIPIMICGITAAAKIQNYSADMGHAKKYCWLPWEASVYAFYLPAALVAIYCVFLLIRVLCALNRHSDIPDPTRSPISRSSWQGNSRHANGEGTPLRYGTHVNTNNNTVLSSSVFSVPRSNEQSYKTQLCGVALLFIFFLLAWVAAALSVAAPSIEKKLSYHDESSKQESNLSEVFSYIYAALAAIMGVFLVIQHLICRRDVRASWCYVCSSCSRLRKGYRRNAEPNSETTSSPQIDGSDRLDVHASVGKTSTPRGNKKIETENGMYTVKTDPVTMETFSKSTDVEENRLVTLEGIASGQMSVKNGSVALSSSEVCNAYHQPHVYADSRMGRAAKSIPSIHSSFVMNHSQPVLNSSFLAHSHSGNKHIHHPCSHDHFMVVDSRGYVPDPRHYQHHAYHSHHHGHLGHPHGQINKPVKLINLHSAHHDSSITEHSFDEYAHNNMHTVPVVMQQHHSQPKVDNTRYQKMRKALERRRAKQKRLNVLREYAQDPLTSNDEGKETKNLKDSNVNELSPLIQSPAKNSLNYNNNLSQLHAVEDPPNQNGSNYRTQFISPPSNKKPDTQKANQARPSGPTRRVKRLDPNGQVRHGKGITSNDKNATQIMKRTKKNMRRSQNSTLSERERDTTSSEKSRGLTNFSSTTGSKNFVPIKTQHNGTVANSPSLNRSSETATNGGNDNHGYLTLQQLQNANPFILNTQNEPIVQSHIVSSQASPKSDKTKDFSISALSNEQFSENSSRMNDGASTVGSRRLPHRNETSV